MATLRTFRAQFPDFIGMVTKAGDKFNFHKGLITTNDPAIIENLEERIAKFKDVTEIDAVEAAKIQEAAAKAAATQSVEERMNANPDGETTISPAALMDRIRMQQQAQQAAAHATATSQMLDPSAKPVAHNPQAGIVSSVQLETAPQSNGKPAKN